MKILFYIFSLSLLVSCIAGSEDTPAGPSLQITSVSSGTFESTYATLTQDLTLTITNAGAAAATEMEVSNFYVPFTYKGGTYPGTGGTCDTSLAPSASCIVVVTFSPTRAGSFSQDFSLFYDLSMVSQTLRATGLTAEASLSISDGETYDYGSKTVTTVNAKSFTVTNSITKGRVTATSLSATGLDAPFDFLGGTYPGTGGSCSTSLAAEGTCTIVVSYTPSASGVSSDTLSLSYDNGPSTATVTRSVTGTGLSIASLAVSDGPSYDFGVLYVGDTADKTFTLTNSGESTASSVSITSSPSTPFSYPGSSFPGGGTCDSSLSSLAGNTACTFIIRFTPTASTTGTITFNYNDGTGTTANASRTFSGTARGTGHVLDTSFNSNGKVRTDINTDNEELYSLSIQADQRVIAVGGDSSAIPVARYNTNGTLDTSFANDGTQYLGHIPGGSWEQAYGSNLQTDGKLLIAGTGLDAFFGISVYRLATSGAVDTTFHTDGVQFKWLYGQDDGLRAVAVQTDGKPVAAGYTLDAGGYAFVLARYKTNGEMDDTIGNIDTGIIADSFMNNSVANAIAIQPDTRIVIAGQASASPSVFGLARYLTEGTFDTAFHTDGKLTFAFGAFDEAATALTIQTDGRLLVAGYGRTGANDDFAIARLTSSGNFDTSFNTNGKALTAVGSGIDRARSLLIEGNGRIRLAGESAGSTYDFGMVRYRTDGSLDTGFGTAGKLTATMGTGHDYARSMALQSDGAVLIGGSASNGFNSDFAIVKYQ